MENPAEETSCHPNQTREMLGFSLMIVNWIAIFIHAGKNAASGDAAFPVSIG